MQKFVLSSKIHRATVTEAELDYIGSITIDEDLMERTGLWEGEKVLVTSLASGERLETYVIRGIRNSGIICMNGPTAHKIKKGEEVVIMGFTLNEKSIKPRVILVDKENKFIKYL